MTTYLEHESGCQNRGARLTWKGKDRNDTELLAQSFSFHTRGVNTPTVPTYNQY